MSGAHESRQKTSRDTIVIECGGWLWTFVMSTLRLSRRSGVLNN